MPVKLGGEEGEQFDIDDAAQCRRVCQYLIGLGNNSALFRVALGMGALLNPQTGLLDPNADTLEVHPRIAAMFDLTAHLRRQIDFSLTTFGPGERTASVLDHIRKELNEVEQSPGDLEEWIDVVILAFDGAWRSGFTPDQITAALAKKQAKNESRSWPDWRTAQPGKAIEHIRAAEGVQP